MFLRFRLLRCLSQVAVGDVPPTIWGGKFHLINVFNGLLYFVAAVQTDGQCSAEAACMALSLGTFLDRSVCEIFWR